jgi:pimeloyl-ACP methyl ester carboxylesterase
MALDVVALMDGLDVEAAHIVGISMGGFIAQLLAAGHAPRVLSMTSIMSGSGDVDPSLIDVLWLEPKSRSEFIQAWVDYIRQFGSPKYFEGDAYSRQTAGAAYDRCYSPEGANRQLLAIFSRKNPGDWVKTISVPTLIIHGADDTLIPPQKGRETAELIPGAKFQLIDGMGHDTPPGRGQLLADKILAFIQSISHPMDQP